MTALHSPPPAKPPWWRDEQVLRLVFQLLFALGVILVLVILFGNMMAGLAKAGLSLGFSFLNNSANFEITEGIPYESSDTYLKAFIVGFVNTISISVVSIFFASILGLLLGMARLSTNWLAGVVAATVTEVFRNIPNLLIMIFWYLAVVLPLPSVASSYSLFGVIFLSQRGLNYPSVIPTLWVIPALTVTAIVIGATTKSLAQQRPDLSGSLRLGLAWVGGLLVFAAFGVFGPESPLQIEIPQLSRFNFQGGSQVSAEFLGVMLGLVTYTGAYIAEVVRGAFLAVPKGQWEASRALGLSELATFQQVIVPQALRIMIPSLNTQYLTLIKNTTLAIAVGYSDMFNISSTIINQSGRSLEVFGMMMSAYLAINLLVSYGMNWLNNHVKLVER